MDYNKPLILGKIWCYDHMEDLTVDEYDYWSKHPLPFGWNIVSKPKR